MKLFSIKIILEWSAKNQIFIKDRIDSCLGRLVLQSEGKPQDYEKTHWGDLFDKIEKEPNNPYNYWSRANRRISKFGNNIVGAIEDLTQVVEIVLNDQEKYPEINLDLCYFLICQNANIYADILMERKELNGAIYYYIVSINSGQEFLKCENRNNKIYDEECKTYTKNSSEQLEIARGSV
jgi:hypothetical protein